jgi:hypothetical protein
MGSICVLVVVTMTSMFGGGNISSVNANEYERYKKRQAGKLASKLQSGKVSTDKATYLCCFSTARGLLCVCVCMWSP